MCDKAEKDIATDETAAAIYLIGAWHAHEQQIFNFIVADYSADAHRRIHAGRDRDRGSVCQRSEQL